MTVWKLKSGADRRIRQGHPWIFSNELIASPKGHPPGAPVTLQDGRGQFLALGYGNPHSLIAFRALSFEPLKDGFDTEFLVSKAIRAWEQRKKLGYERSFRLVYGEGDYFPGLVIDRYLVEQNGKRGQVLVAQILTAGMSVALKEEETFFRRLCEEAQHFRLTDLSWEETAIVIRNDVQIRRLEGLEVQEPRWLSGLKDWNLAKVDILLDSPIGNDPILMKTDLLEGQKTGFFLDQAFNIQVLCNYLQKAAFEKRVRVLDLCCYVGQWSTKISRVLRERGFEVEVTAADISDKALAFAKENIEREGATVIPKEYDVMRDLSGIPDRHFDIVIADPPAFIKAKKDVPTGRHAYLKLNSQAFKLTRPGGLVVSCSCSGLFREEDMIEVLAKASRRGELEARCIAKGGHGGDHPVLLSFEEGFYLKMFIHQLSFN